RGMSLLGGNRWIASLNVPTATHPSPQGKDGCGKRSTILPKMAVPRITTAITLSHSPDNRKAVGKDTKSTARLREPRLTPLREFSELFTQPSGSRRLSMHRHRPGAL